MNKRTPRSVHAYCSFLEKLLISRTDISITKNFIQRENFTATPHSVPVLNQIIFAGKEMTVCF
jgi:hypothetical protein